MNLKSRGLPVDDIVLMLMSDHGVELYGNVWLVSPKFAGDKPEAVKGFIKALTKGLRDTLADPAAATATVIKRNARQISSTPEGLACARFRTNSAWDTRELKLSRTILRRVKDEKVAFWINAKELKTLTTFKSAIGSDTFNKINAVMASPLISGDKNLGLIQLFSYKVFTDEDVNILRLLTAQTSLVIRNASRTSGLRSMRLRLRENTPPPALIEAGS